MIVNGVSGAATSSINMLEYGKLKQIGENTFKEVVKPKYGNMAGDILEKTKAGVEIKKKAIELPKDCEALKKIGKEIKSKKIKLAIGITAGVVALATAIGLIAKSKSKQEPETTELPPGAICTTSV